MRSVSTAIVVEVRIATNEDASHRQERALVEKTRLGRGDDATKYPEKAPVIMMSPWAKLMSRSTP